MLLEISAGPTFRLKFVAFILLSIFHHKWNPITRSLHASARGVPAVFLVGVQAIGKVPVYKVDRRGIEQGHGLNDDRSSGSLSHDDHAATGIR